MADEMTKSSKFGDQMSGSTLAATAGLKNITKPKELDHPCEGTFNGLGIEHIVGKMDEYGKCCDM